MLKEGDVIELIEGHSVYADVPNHFCYTNCKGDFSLTHHNVTIGEEFMYLAGKYIVVKTAFEGGGTGHGPGDIFPDGHHVFCEMAGGDHKVDFYQSGCFTAMIEDIKPIGNAFRTWTLDKEAEK